MASEADGANAVQPAKKSRLSIVKAEAGGEASGDENVSMAQIL